MSVAPSSAPTNETSRDDPAGRGLTRVAPHVVERIAAYACERVDGTITPRTAAKGSSAPTVRARADVSGPRAHLAITVGMSYAQPVAATAVDVRNAVRADVERLCGMRVVAVDVEALPVHTMRRSRVR